MNCCGTLNDSIGQEPLQRFRLLWAHRLDTVKASPGKKKHPYRAERQPTVCCRSREGSCNLLEKVLSHHSLGQASHLVAKTNHMSTVQPQGSVTCHLPWVPHSHGGLACWQCHWCCSSPAAWTRRKNPGFSRALGLGWVGLVSAPPAQLGPSAGRRREQPQLMLSCL